MARTPILRRFVRIPTGLVVGVGVGIFGHLRQDAIDRLCGYEIGRWGALLSIPQPEVLEDLADDGRILADMRDAFLSDWRRL